MKFNYDRPPSQPPSPAGFDEGFLLRRRARQEKRYLEHGVTAESIKSLIDTWKRKDVNMDYKESRETRLIFYPVPSDSILSLYNGFDVEGKRVVTVAGSGEFAEAFIDRGAKKVEIFDRSVSACILNELKIVAAQLLSYQEYLAMFGTVDITSPDQQEIILFDPTFYPRLRPYLTNQAQTYIDLILQPGYEKFFRKKLYAFNEYNSHIIYRKHGGDRTIAQRNPFLKNELSYQAFQEKIRKVRWAIYAIDIGEIHDQDHDYAYLSNIGLSYLNTLAFAIDFIDNNHPRRVGITLSEDFSNADPNEPSALLPKKRILKREIQIEVKSKDDEVSLPFYVEVSYPYRPKS